MAEFGKLGILSYKPGERQKWLAIEANILSGLKSDYGRNNNWQVTLREAEPKLKRIKAKMVPADHAKMDYHADKAGREFLEWVGQEVPEETTPVFQRGILLPGASRN